MDSRHTVYLNTFLAELEKLGYSGQITEELVKQLTNLVNRNISAEIAAEIIYNKLTKK